MNKALEALQWLLRVAQYEYPEAEYTASQQYGVKPDELREEYDKACM